jgi:hypothetical protein
LNAALHFPFRVKAAPRADYCFGLR